MEQNAVEQKSYRRKDPFLKTEFIFRCEPITYVREARRPFTFPKQEQLALAYHKTQLLSEITFVTLPSGSIILKSACLFAFHSYFFESMELLAIKLNYSYPHIFENVT